MADLASSPYMLLVLVASAFTLPLVFVWWIRNTRRIGRPPMPVVLKAFAWGAVFSVLMALVLEVLLGAAAQSAGPLYVFLSKHFTDPETIFLVVVLAPFVEEAAKAVSARVGKPVARARVDGLVFGAAAGLGFSATENLLNGLKVLTEAGGSASAFLAVIVIRSFSASLLHASATAVTGYGLATGWLTRRPYAFLPYYLVAVTMHATYNFLASFGETFTQYGDLGTLVGFGAAVLFAVVAVTLVRYKLAYRRPTPVR
ncbi:MAG TPA: PrsW family intramembrane metalloprotease [Thermoplasmata archaeon]|nr:PrsW family intramembrane metalloprotease [Thermoplasmata archaeon]